jgi:hypothetical protein
VLILKMKNFLKMRFMYTRDIKEEGMTISSLSRGGGRCYTEFGSYCLIGSRVCTEEFKWQASVGIWPLVAMLTALGRRYVPADEEIPSRRGCVFITLLWVTRYVGQLDGCCIYFTRITNTFTYGSTVRRAADNSLAFLQHKQKNFSWMG